MDTTEEYLEGESIRFRKPARLARTSRYFLERDLPWLREDSTKLASVQRALYLMEFRDEHIDVFVDTVSRDRLVVIANTGPIDFTNGEAAALRADLQYQSDEMAALDTTVVRGPIEGQLKGTGELRMARYAQRLSLVADGASWMHRSYFLTGSRFTLLVTEVATDEGLIEPYLWSVKSS